MKDLIAHANELRKAQGKSANLTIDSFSDIIEAVHLVQEELNITGTTAKEASGTLEGSAKQMQAAWENFVGSLADKNEYATISAQELGNAVITYFQNLFPAVERFMEGIRTAILYIGPVIERELPKLLETYAPKFATAFSRLVKAAAAVLPRVAKTVLPAAINSVIDVVNALFGTAVPHIKEIRFPSWNDIKTAAEHTWNVIQAGFRTFGGLVFGTTKDGAIKWPKWSEIQPQAEEAFRDIVNGITSLPGKLSEFGDTLAMQLLGFDANSFEVFEEGSGWAQIGAAIFQGIKDGIAQAGNIVAEILDPGSVTIDNTGWGVVGGHIVTAIGTAFKGADAFLLQMFLGNKYVEGKSKWDDVGKEISDSLQKLFNSKITIDGKEVTLFENIGNTLVESLRKAGTNAVDFLYGLLTDKTASEQMSIGEKLSGIFAGIVDIAFDALDTGENLILRLLLGDDAETLSANEAWNQVGLNIHKWIESIFKAPEGENTESVGEHIFNRIWEGLQSGASKVGDFVLGLFGFESWDDLFADLKEVDFGKILGEAIGSIGDIGDTIYSMLKPGENFEAGEGWSKIGESIIGGISSGITKTGDWLAKALHPDEKINIGEGWETVGKDIIDGISVAFKSVDNFLLRLILGDDYEDGKNWGDVGKKVRESLPDFWEGIQDLFTPKDNGEESIGQHLFNAIWEGVKAGAENMGDLLLGLIWKDYESGKGWGDLGASIWEDFTSGFNFDWLTNIINKAIDILNFFGADIKHLGVGKSFEDDTKSIEGEEEQAKSLIQTLETLYQTYGQSAKDTELWISNMAQLERIIPGISNIFYDENGDIQMNTQLIEENIAAWKRLATEKAIAVGLEREMSKVIEAEGKRLDAQQAVEAAREKMEPYQNKAQSLTDIFFSPEKLANTNDPTLKANALQIATSYAKALYDAAQDTGYDTSILESLMGADSIEEFQNLAQAFNFEDFINNVGMEKFATILADFKEKISGIDPDGTLLRQIEGVGKLMDTFGQMDFGSVMTEYTNAMYALDAATKLYEGSVQNYTSYYEAYSAALSTAQSTAQEANSSVESLRSSINGLPNEKIINIRINTSGGEGLAEEVTINGASVRTATPNAKGLAYVPTNEYLTRLHKGEAVLSANEARRWRESKFGGGVDSVAIADAVRGAITEAMGNMMFVMNGKQVASAVGGAVGQRISGFQKANSAGYGR